MKNLSIISIFALVALMSCTKSKEVHPELGDGNEEFLTVGATTAHVEYTRTDIAELRKVVFHYSLSGSQPFVAAEMAKKEDFLDLTLNDLVSDMLYQYYYELFPSNGESSITEQKTFHTLAVDSPVPPTPPVVDLPTVVTIEVSGITANSAVCGGEVTNDGGTEVTERGICWSTNANPTLNDNHVTAGTGTGSFSATMNGLEANTTYHVRAYATNSAGTAYGLDKEFTTLSGGGNGVPEGAINGLFTINADGDQVYFSQGSLQYQASTNTWRFAENQWNYVGSQNPDYGEPGGTVNGSDNNNVSSTYSGWIDLFGWGTSGYNHGAVCFQPFCTSTSFADYFAYGQYAYDLKDQTGKADWGYNRISNGGTENTWRTLTIEELLYIFESRNTASGIRYAMANVNDVGGVILLPDDWNTSCYNLNSINNGQASFNSNTITASQWVILEQCGAVFLPAAGRRDGNLVYNVGTYGYYWTASYYDRYCVSLVYVYDSNLGLLTNSSRGHGQSVRLVQDANR